MTTTEAVFDLEGMTCASCVSSVEQAIRGLPQVTTAEVSLPLHTARVELQTDEESTLRAIVTAVGQAGFRATPRATLAPGEDPLQHEVAAAQRRLAKVDTARRRFVLALVAEVPLLALSLAMLAGLALPPWTAYLQLVLAALVMLAGAPIYGVAAKLALHAKANMDTLVALGTGVAFGASLHGLATGGALHFGPVGMIVSLVLLGRFLEARAQGQTGAALRALLDLAPPVARRVDAAGEATEVPIGSLAPGDLVRVLPGETIPIDGAVVSGQASVSEAMLTGESAPVAKGPDDAVVGGTLDLDGPLTIRATHVGSDTRLAGIVRLVASAQGSKAAVERLADRVSGIFVPVITLLALATGLGWYFLRPDVGLEGALMAAVAVLVVACPCALGLATPTAIVVAIGRAARSGILIREASALERLREVTHVVFDKTGTLTQGLFAVTEVEIIQAPGADPLLCWAAALEAHSEHPIARGIVAERERRGLPALAATDVAITIGGGVHGKVAGADLRVGAPAFLAEAGVDLSALPAPAGSATQVVVARNGELAGSLMLADALRPTAREAIAALQAAGVTCVLLSGDRQAVADEVGAALGITEVRAEVTPEGKLAEIVRLRASGATVAMVGDGLNDAPALAAADVGIAMGQGTDVAREAAAVTLLRDDPRAVAETLSLARATLRTVRQNLVWAFGYNVVTVPLAMLKLLHPVAAAGAMAASSVLVVLNSLRLRGGKT